MRRELWVALFACLLMVGVASGQTGTLSHSKSDAVDDGSFGCFYGGALAHPDNHYYRTFTICETPFELFDGIEITNVVFGANCGPAAGLDSQPVIVRIYQDPTGSEPTLDDLIMANLLGEEEFEIEGVTIGGTVEVEFTVPILIPCDTTFVVEIFTPDGFGVSPGFAFPFNCHQFGIGTNDAGETSPSYIYMPGCGMPDITPFNDLFTGAEIDIVMDVIYSVAGECGCGGPGTDCQSEAVGGYKITYRQSDDFSSAPGLPVSDTSPAIDTIEATGTDVFDLDCSVNIPHTFLEDLTVELTSPAAATITLHNEGGINLDNLITTFDDEGRPNGRPYDVGDHMVPSGPGTLGVYDSADPTGTWTLAVTDAFPVDDGVLDSWTLHFNSLLEVADTGEAAVAVLTVPFANIDDIRDLDVELNVSHATPDDLVIELESPLGTTVTIVDGTLPTGTPDFIVRVSDESGTCDAFGTLATSTGSLADFDGEALVGDWTLTATDTSVNGSIGGGIVDWSLLVAPQPCAEVDAAVADDQCEFDAVLLSWELPEGVDYAGIEIRRDGATLATLAGTAVLYEDLAPEAGPHVYEIIADCDPGRSRVVLNVDHVRCCPVSGLAAVTVCGSEDVELTWGIDAEVVYESINVVRDGVTVALDLPADATDYVDLDVPTGFHTYVVEGVCGGVLGTSSATLVFLHAPYDGHTDLVYAPVGDVLGDFGGIDSGAAILDALTANGRSALRIPSLDYPCMPEGSEIEHVWVALGTDVLTSGHILTLEEGTILSELVTGDTGLNGSVDHPSVGIYIEGADNWGGPVPLTDFDLYDGVEPSADGDDTFVSMNGASHGDLDLTDFDGVDYTHDQPVSDFTDELLPTGTTAAFAVDLGGDDAGAIWQNDGTGGGGIYNTGIFYQALYTIGTDEVAGRVIAQSWEFGGFTGDTEALMGRYLEALEPPAPPVADFSATPVAGSPPLDVDFTDLSTGSPTGWEWDFGDGATSTAQNPTHSYEDEGTFDVTLTARNSGGTNTIVKTGLITVSGGAPLFKRGNADGNGVTNALQDAIYILKYQFQGGTAPPCMDAADVNNNGGFNALQDAIFLLSWQFSGGPTPPSPGPTECGPDPAGTSLGCETSPAACL